MNKFFFKKNSGFTIIETMISISIFIIVVMIGMNALLNASFIHQKNRDQRSIMDNLTFIMEDMSRNIRTGYNYYCTNGGMSVVVGGTPQSCVSGNQAIVFETADGNPNTLSDQWIYNIYPSDDGIGYNIWKSIGGSNGTFVQLNPEEIKLDGTSGFIVTGAESSTDSNPNKQQPLVTIRLVGTITTKGVAMPFSLQTTVSQRNLDQ